MTDHEYAAVLYCRVFRVEDDGGETYVQGVKDALGTLKERERLALEGRLRYGKTYKLIEKELGMSAQAARRVVNTAICKLRHPFRIRMMSMARVEEERSLYRQASEEAKAINEKLNRLVFLLVRGMPINEELHAAYDKLEMRVDEAGFLPQAAKALYWANIKTVGDLYDVDSYERLTRIRNIGTKYIGSLIGRMRELGFNKWADAIESEKA
jgi:hypothetical protein